MAHNGLQNIAHWLHSAQHADKQGSSKAAGVVYIAIGLFTIPFLIGIPLVIYGIYKLCK